MKYNISDIGGEIVKDNEVYLLKDNKTLKNLVVSSTALKPNQSTRGHNHSGQEEVYFFINGNGTMELDDRTIEVESGSVVLIEDGVFHRVHNPTDSELYFVCVFDGKRNH
jgi:mannose-6-phosphate isomerase-like protein (cupin superfamily)